MTLENKEHFQSEKEALFLLLTTQFQLEVNDIRAERIAKSANPLALLAAAPTIFRYLLSCTKTSKSNAI
ncbi:hypothetical protein Tco_1409417 [Tanacetum coccineum]